MPLAIPKTECGSRNRGKGVRLAKPRERRAARKSGFQKPSAAREIVGNGCRSQIRNPKTSAARKSGIQKQVRLAKSRETGAARKSGIEKQVPPAKPRERRAARDSKNRVRLAKPRERRAARETAGKACGSQSKNRVRLAKSMGSGCGYCIGALQTNATKVVQ